MVSRGEHLLVLRREHLVLRRKHLALLVLVQQVRGHLLLLLHDAELWGQLLLLLHLQLLLLQSALLPDLVEMSIAPGKKSTRKQQVNPKGLSQPTWR